MGDSCRHCAQAWYCLVGVAFRTTYSNSECNAELASLSNGGEFSRAGASRKWQGETVNGDEDSAQPKCKKQSWRQSGEKIDEHHAGSSKKKWRDDKEKEYQELSQSSWGKQKWPPDEEDQPKWNEKEGWREEDWREGKEKGDEESSQLKWKKESWKDDREKGGQDSSKQRWSKGGERGESERGGDHRFQPPPPPSPSVPPTPPSPSSTVRGSVGRVFQSDAAVGKKGVTVLTRVGGPIRQPSSQGSLQQMSLEQSRKHSIRTEPETETHVSVLNQLSTEKNLEKRRNIEKDYVKPYAQRCTTRYTLRLE